MELRNISAEVDQWNEAFLDNQLIVKKMYEPFIAMFIFSFCIYLISLFYEKYQDYQLSKLNNSYLDDRIRRKLQRSNHSEHANNNLSYWFKK